VTILPSLIESGVTTVCGADRVAVVTGFSFFLSLSSLFCAAIGWASAREANIILALRWEPMPFTDPVRLSRGNLGPVASCDTRSEISALLNAFQDRNGKVNIIRRIEQ
jgi:hypothetical protein